MILFLFPTFASYSPDVEAWGARSKEKRKYRKLQRKRRRAERRGLYQAPDTQQSGGAHGGSELPANPTESDDVTPLPPAEPDADDVNTIQVGTVEIDEAKKSAVRYAFCGEKSHSIGGPMITQLPKCFGAKSRGDSYSAASSYSTMYNAARANAKNASSDRDKEVFAKELEWVKKFRELVLGQNPELMNNDISPTRYEGQMDCQIRPNPPAAALDYSDFYLTCDLQKASNGSYKCPKSDLYIRSHDQQDVKEKLCI